MVSRGELEPEGALVTVYRLGLTAKPCRLLPDLPVKSVRKNSRGGGSMGSDGIKGARAPHSSHG